MAKHSARILELAKRGAEARLQDLIQEGKYLMELFPHLKDSFDADELPVPFIIKRGARRSNRKATTRRPMSAAARKALSRRMKKYWAAKRQQA